MSLLEKFFKLDLCMENINIAWKSKDGEPHYESTPVGAYIFASTGCDGASFCIIPRHGDETFENSPVFNLSPMDFSSGTVVWASKNFEDFLRLTVLFKTAWGAGLYDIYNISETEFEEAIKDRNEEIKTWNKSKQKQLKEIINSIQSILPKTKVRYDYDYFINSYRNTDNHIDLEFKSDVKMHIYKLGCYCHDD